MNAPSESTRRGTHRYKMKQLVDATGLPRQAIHFYIQEGLIPPGKKTGRNMALYTEEHLARLLTIKKLQHEHFLPLKAIKAVLDGRETGFAPEQRQFLSEVRTKLGDSMVPPPSQKTRIDFDAVCARLELDAADVERMLSLGLITVVPDENGVRLMDESKIYLLELLSQLRKLGFSHEIGFTVDEIAFYDDHIEKLVQAEIDLLFRRTRDLPPEVTARLIETALPLVGTLLARQHENKVRELFGALL